MIVRKYTKNNKETLLRFQHINTIYKIINKVFNKYNVILETLNGALLGIIRNNCILPYDNDYDCKIYIQNENDINIVFDILPKYLKKYNYYIKYKQFNYIKSSNTCYFIIKFYHYINYMIDMDVFIITRPYSVKLTKIYLKNYNINIYSPANIEKYLVDTYTKLWKNPIDKDCAKVIHYCSKYYKFINVENCNNIKNSSKSFEKLLLKKINDMNIYLILYNTWNDRKNNNPILS